MSQHSAAALLNPKSLKQSLVNGTPLTSPSAYPMSTAISSSPHLQDMDSQLEPSPAPPQETSRSFLTPAAELLKMSPVPEGEAEQSSSHSMSGEQPHFEQDQPDDGQNLTSDLASSPVVQTDNTQSHLPPSTTSAIAPPPLSEQTAQCVQKDTVMEGHSAYEEPDHKGRQKPTSQSAVGPLSIDPKALLNPKSGPAPQQVNGHGAESSRKRSTPPSSKPASGPSQPLFDFSTASNGDLKDGQANEDESEPTGISKFIEQTHGVTERDNRPMKRQKKTHDLQPASWSGGKNGDISGHFKELEKDEELRSQLQVYLGTPKSQENLAAKPDDDDDDGEERPNQHGKQNGIVDLTEDVDDEVTITGSVTKIIDPEDEEVCFGSVQNAAISAHQIPAPSPKARALMKNQWPMIKVRLVRHRVRSGLHIFAYDGEDRDFGQLDYRFAFGIAPMMDQGLISRLQGRLLMRKRGPFEYAGQKASDSIPMMLNLYGKRKHAKLVTNHLATKKVQLTRPTHFDRDMEYYNPHEEVVKTKIRTTGGRPAYSTSLNKTIEEIESGVMQIFDTSQEAADLPEMEADTSLIKTPLLPHQKQALHFMTTRELDGSGSQEDDEQDGKSLYRGNSLWRVLKERNGNVFYENILDGYKQTEKPRICRGGVLADMMGLGKTLSVLALCASTVQSAADWAATAPEVEVDKVKLKNIKTTLLVAPLSVVANWEEQIRQHTKADSFKFYVYHSKNRESDLEKLGEFDMIVTTYSIVSSEMHRVRTARKTGTSPFRAVNFFRIVLDEAHAIREPSTLQNRAICQVESPRRWGITGTPIQNKLEDFGSLLRFIRLSPFDSEFKKTIIQPFKLADPVVIPKLRILVDSVTLRRTKDRLDLPKRNDLVTKLCLRESEERLYRWFAVDARRKAQALAFQDKAGGGKRWHTFLRTILTCRTICDASDLLNEDDMKLAEGYSEGLPIDLEDESTNPEMSERSAYEMLALFEDTDMVHCAQCKENLMEKEAENGTIGYMMECFQIICSACIANFRKEVEQFAQNGTFSCPFCGQIDLQPRFFELTEGGFDRAKNRAEELKKKPRQKIVSRYSGPSTKTSALISALEESRDADKKASSYEASSKPPNKSVVFSCWTSYLDLLEMALEENDEPFKYVRLDGKMSREKRKASLQAFSDDPSVTVLLASIGTGGLGLNLTVANNVYIMEPQWNPAAEAQAVDRVHRLGQKRDVTTVRFIIENSIENGMAEMQRKKLELADISMTKKKMDKKETAKEKLMNLASLFK